MVVEHALLTFLHSSICKAVELFTMFTVGKEEVIILEPSYKTPFILMVDKKEGFLDVDEKLLCLHFNVQHMPLPLVEKEEYDEDMVLMRTIYQRPCFSSSGTYYRVIP